ncbi:unnamed protein product [Knipowitschia caucasica]
MCLICVININECLYFYAFVLKLIFDKATLFNRKDKADMFHNKSAWFSSSVPEKCKQFWMMEGGTIRGWETADYLFSQDALCPDTKRIYSSRDYLFNKVTVFHSCLLSACEKRRSFQSVCVGHYVLPPYSVQEALKNHQLDNNVEF